MTSITISLYANTFCEFISTLPLISDFELRIKIVIWRNHLKGSYRIEHYLTEKNTHNTPYVFF